MEPLLTKAMVPPQMILMVPLPEMRHMMTNMMLITTVLVRIIGSGQLSCKLLLVRIVENNKNDDYLGPVRLSKG